MNGWLLIACLVVLPASAEVFTYVDAQGNRVFTDQPGTGNAKRVPLATSNRMSANPTGAAPLKAEKKAAVRPALHYDMLRVLVPEPDATIRSSAGELIVSISSEPGPSPVFALSNIDRGSHQLSIEILDEQGRTVERTANQPFHMQRISLAQKRKTQPCTLTDYGQRPECPLKDKPPEEKNPFLRFF